jgi:opacity protein-like surface antigen
MDGGRHQAILLAQGIVMAAKEIARRDRPLLPDGSRQKGFSLYVVMSRLHDDRHNRLHYHAVRSLMRSSKPHRLFAVSLMVIALFTQSTPSLAQGFVSPLIGYDFGGDSGCPQLRNCEDKRLNVGVALGVLGPIVGFEEEIADARDFFGRVPGQSSSVVTVMTNVMIVPRLGPIHPYVVGGLGLMKTHVDFTASTLLATKDNSLAWDLGGGVFVFFSSHLGVRGDIRHFHSLKQRTVPLLGTTFTDARLTFGRASASLVLAF